MSNEHNPIALLISQIQSKWIDEIGLSENIQLVRWLIKPEQAKLFEGFLKLESSEHGKIPDVLLVFLTPFKDINSFSHAINEQWLKMFQEDQNIIDDYKKNNPNFNWDSASFKTQSSSEEINQDQLLVEMISSFKNQLPEKTPLTIAFLPYTIEDVKKYAQWLQQILSQKIEKLCRIMVFDHVQDRHFDKLLRQNPSISKSLSIPLDVEGAMQKLAATGNPNDPEFQFRQCILNMSKATQNKNLTEVEKWGQRGIEVAQKTGLKNMLSTAHLVFASMLFSFKAFEKVDDLLAQGLSMAKKGLAAGDETCQNLVIQHYGYQASSNQFQKKYDLACNLFCKQAECYLEISLPQQAITAWWMAGNTIKKRDSERFKTIVTMAFTEAKKHDKETLKLTTIGFIADDYYKVLYDKKQLEQCEEVDRFMIPIEGEHWRSSIKEQRKTLERKRLSLFNWM